MAPADHHSHFSYLSHVSSHLDSMKSDGSYRLFTPIERLSESFPKGILHSQSDEGKNENCDLLDPENEPGSDMTIRRNEKDQEYE